MPDRGVAACSILMGLASLALTEKPLLSSIQEGFSDSTKKPGFQTEKPGSLSAEATQGSGASLTTQGQTSLPLSLFPRGLLSHHLKEEFRLQWVVPLLALLNHNQFNFVHHVIEEWEYWVSRFLRSQWFRCRWITLVFN
jgi:hypothetical protein